MINKANETYTKVTEAVKNDIESSSQTYEVTPPNFPHLYFFQSDNPTVDTDLENHENAVQPMIEISTYAKGEGKLNKCMKISTLADASMNGMGYQRIFGPRELPNADATICRVISRYRRIFASND